MGLSNLEIRRRQKKIKEIYPNIKLQPDRWGPWQETIWRKINEQSSAATRFRLTGAIGKIIKDAQNSTSTDPRNMWITGITQPIKRTTIPNKTFEIGEHYLGFDGDYNNNWYWNGNNLTDEEWNSISEAQLSKALQNIRIRTGKTPTEAEVRQELGLTLAEEEIPDNWSSIYGPEGGEDHKAYLATIAESQKPSKVVKKKKRKIKAKVTPKAEESRIEEPKFNPRIYTQEPLLADNLDINGRERLTPWSQQLGEIRSAIDGTPDPLARIYQSDLYQSIYNK